MRSETATDPDALVVVAAPIINDSQKGQSYSDKTVMDVARSDQEFFGGKRKVVFQGEPAISRSDSSLRRSVVSRDGGEHDG